MPPSSIRPFANPFLVCFYSPPLFPRAYRFTSVKFYSTVYHHAFCSLSFRAIRSDCHKVESFDTGKKLWLRLKYIWKNFFTDEKWADFMELVRCGKVSLRCEFTAAESAVGFKPPLTATKFAEETIKRFEDKDHKTLRALLDFFGMELVSFSWNSIRADASLILRKAQHRFHMPNASATPPEFIKPAQHTFELLCRAAGYLDKFSKGLNTPAFKLCYRYFKKSSFRVYSLLIWRNDFITEGVRRGDRVEQGTSFVAGLPTRDDMKDLVSVVVTTGLSEPPPFQVDTASDQQIGDYIIAAKKRILDTMAGSFMRFFAFVPKTDVLAFIHASDSENVVHLSEVYTPHELKHERKPILSKIVFAFQHAGFVDHTNENASGEPLGFFLLRKPNGAVHLKRFSSKVAASVWAVCKCERDGTAFKDIYMVVPCEKRNCPCTGVVVVDTGTWECGPWTGLAKVLQAHTVPMKMVKGNTKVSMAFQSTKSRQGIIGPWIGSASSTTNFSFPMRWDPACLENHGRFIQCYVEYLKWTSEQTRGKRPSIRDDTNADFADIITAFKDKNLWTEVPEAPVAANGGADDDIGPVNEEDAIDSDGEENLIPDRQAGDPSSSSDDSSSEEDSIDEDDLMPMDEESSAAVSEFDDDDLFG